MAFGRELVVMLTKPCMFGGQVEVSTKNIMYRFIEGQTHFKFSCVKMSLTLNELI